MINVCGFHFIELVTKAPSVYSITTSRLKMRKGKNMTRTLIAAAVIACGLMPALAQESWSEGFPGSVFVVPDAQGETFQATNDYEVITDLPLFLARGFKEPNWDAHSSLVPEVARELVVPDYVKRTGNTDPGMYSIEVANAPIMKQGVYDLVVVSRLPGDCDEKGCLFQIYHLEGSSWTKAYEFRALGMAYRDGGDLNTTMIAAIGDEDTPSRLIEWDGEKFSEE